jgi:ubiquinone biosynthesis protein COQ4
VANDPIAGMSWLQQWRARLQALYRLARNPDDTEQAFILMSTHLNADIWPGLLARVEADPMGRALIARRASIDTRSVDLDALARLPAGTLGHEYVKFLRANGLSPDIFHARHNLGHPEVTYLHKRARQTHDLWHVLGGFGADITGEVEVQAFTYAQIGALGALLIVAGGTLRAGLGAPRLFARARAAYARGRAASFLLVVAWEDHWAEPLAALRARYLREGPPAVTAPAA